MTTSTIRLGAVAFCAALMVTAANAQTPPASSPRQASNTSGQPNPPATTTTGTTTGTSTGTTTGTTGGTTTGTTTGTTGSPTLRPLPGIASATTADYRLGPGDKLRVEVYKDAQLSQSLQVRPDGKVTLPLIGDIVAADLTPIQLRDRITTSLKEYVTNPVVTVIVVEANPAMIYVMGEVNQPGSIPMRGPMTVLQALAMSGGFREFANPKNIRILRRYGNQQKVETIRFNYNDAIKGTAAPVFLSPGDMVVVP